MKKLTLLLLVIQIALFSLKAENKTCNFFLIKESGSEVILEKAQLTENEVKVFTDPRIISYIMVFNPGSKSGELIQQDQQIKGIIARYSNGKIYISILRKDNSQKEMPTLDLELAKNTDVRLNITGANGYKKVYLIESFETIKDGEGPVLDMFASKGPLKNGEYSFCTESMESLGEIALEGSVPYEIYKGWITVNCKLPNGKTGRFVVDFGAAQTTISKQELPENFPIQKLEMVEYSSAGTKVSNAVAAGASGTIDNIAGVAFLNEFALGNIKIPNQKVMVVQSFPEILIEYNIAGIIGRDILLKSNVFEIHNLDIPDGDHKLIFSKNLNPRQSPNYSIPYKMAGGYLTFDGKIENIPVSYIFDSGAASTYINKDFLDNSGISYKVISDKKETSMGLDGKGSEHTTVQLKNVRIGNVILKEKNFFAGNTFALDNIGLNDKTVLLGLDFLRNYNDVVFDFNNQKMFLWE